jgi:hypothetical protein
MSTTTSVPTLSLRGKSGASYGFNVYSINTEFNFVPAVYGVTRRDAQGNHTVIYVGQTGDMSERMDQHHKWDCFTRNKANCICVHQQKSEATRLAIEQDLIAAYNPPCNG